MCSGAVLCSAVDRLSLLHASNESRVTGRSRPSSRHLLVPFLPDIVDMASLQLAVLTVFFLLTDVLLTTGVIFGWAGLERQLIAEGQFHSLCPAGTTGTCAAQLNALSVIAIVAFNVANIATVVHGLTLDRYGVRSNSVVGGLLFTLGMLLLSVSDSQSFNAFIPAYTFIGWGGIAVFLASFQFANLYAKPNLWRAIINALFTAAGISFTIVDWLYSAGYKRDAVLGVYTSVAAVLTVGMLALYPTHSYEEGDEVSLPIVEWYTNTPAPPRRRRHSHAHDNGVPAAGTESKDKDEQSTEWSVAAASVYASSDIAHEVPLDGADSDEVGHAYDRGDFFHKGSAAVANGGTDAASLGKEPGLLAAEHAKNTASVWDEVKDPQTLLLALFFSVGLLFSNWFNATIGTQLTAMGDSAGHWAIAFIFISSFLPIPIAVLIAHWFRTIGYSGSVGICTIALAMSYLPLYLDVLWVQLLAFLFYTLSRALVITVMFSYAATQYRSDHYGRVVAIITVIATPLGFLQLLMQDRSSGEYGYKGVNTICALCILPAMLYAYYLKRKGL